MTASSWAGSTMRHARKNQASRLPKGGGATSGIVFGHKHAPFNLKRQKKTPKQAGTEIMQSPKKGKPGRLANTMARNLGWMGMIVSLHAAVSACSPLLAAAPSMVSRRRPSDRIICPSSSRPFKMHTTCNGALSASSTISTRPSLHARTRGESLYVTTPFSSDVDTVSD